MVHALPRFVPRSLTPAVRATLAAALFWVFTYAVLTGRASMIYGDAFSLTNERRLVALTAGAGIFWLVLRKMVIGQRSRSFHPGLIVATVLPAAFGVLGTRYLMDGAVFQDIRPLDESLRWVLVWAGYYGLWICGLLAFEIHSGRFGPAPRRPVVASTSSAGSAPIAQPAVSPRSTVEDWEWLIDALAAEAESLSAGQRAELSRRLIATAGYELADAGDSSAAAHNAKVKLAGRIADRLSARP